MNSSSPFSAQLETWLKTDKPKTIGSLQLVFKEKSFAILFLLLMFIPSLPIPTGGITHLVLLPIVWIASLQMIFGRRTLWFPGFIERIKLGDTTIKKALPFMIRRIEWFERFSRPRKENLIETAWFRTFTGLCMFIFALAAFVSPPFSGLDTLPSMGAVIIALSLILGDMAMFFVGLVVGLLGIGLIGAAAGAIATFIKHYF